MRRLHELVALGRARRAAEQALEALVQGISDDDLGDLVDPGPAPAEPEDAHLMALDDARIAAETGTGGRA